MKLRQCEEAIQLVDEMEECFQNLHLLPNQECTDPGLLKLEAHFLDMCSSLNVVKSALYIVPVYHNGKLFLRYMEQGIYRGFTSHFLSAITSKYNVPFTNVYPWMVYTHKDFSESSIRMKYTGRSQTARGFGQLMYRNKNSVSSLVGKLKPKLDNLHCVIHVEMKDQRPTDKEDR